MRTKLTSKLGLASASIFALAVAAPTVVAQEDAAAADDDRRLSTVTVTATQRTESIQDVPIAVTALDPELLQRAGVADVTSLDSVAPSFNMPQYSNRHQLALGSRLLRRLCCTWP